MSIKEMKSQLGLKKSSLYNGRKELIAANVIIAKDSKENFYVNPHCICGENVAELFERFPGFTTKCVSVQKQFM